MLNKIIGKILIYIFLLMFFLVTLQVVSRFFPIFTFTWTEELSRFCYIWLSFLGAISVTIDNNHIQIRSIFEKFSKKNQKSISCLIDSGIIICCVATMIGGIRMIKPTWKAFAPSMPGLVSYGHLYLIIPLSMFAIILVTLFDLYKKLIK